MPWTVFLSSRLILNRKMLWTGLMHVAIEALSPRMLSI
jgi:hypothetical protein